MYVCSEKQLTVTEQWFEYKMDGLVISRQNLSGFAKGFHKDSMISVMKD